MYSLSLSLSLSLSYEIVLLCVVRRLHPYHCVQFKWAGRRTECVPLGALCRYARVRPQRLNLLNSWLGLNGCTHLPQPCSRETLLHISIASQLSLCVKANRSLLHSSQPPTPALTPPHPELPAQRCSTLGPGFLLPSFQYLLLGAGSLMGDVREPVSHQIRVPS